MSGKSEAVRLPAAAAAADVTSDLAEDRGAAHWQRNLVVCVFGCFTTIVAMTLLLPFLPLYVEQLGVTDHAAIAEWSGAAYGATFFTAALCAPLWGRLADLYGRKLMLIRASLGMAVAMSLIGMAQNVWQLVALRLLAGLLGGYASGSVVLVATQTPKSRSGWALGVLSSGVMAGNLAGPLIGGFLPPLIGIRWTFFAAGAVIFVTFIATTCLIKEEKRAPAPGKTRPRGGWAAVPDKGPVIAMLATGLLLMLANMSIEPIITVYVAQLVRDARQVTIVAGLVMSAAALGSILSASRLGKLADRIGHWNVIVAVPAGLGGVADPAGFRHHGMAACGVAVPDGAVARRPAAMHRQRDSPQRAGWGGRRDAGLFHVFAVCRAGGGTAGGRFHRRAFRHACGVSWHLGADGGGRGV